MTQRKRSSKLSKKRERRLVVRGIRRDSPDLRKLGRALISLAQAEAEREATTQHAAYQSDQPSSEDASAPDVQGGGADGPRHE